MKLPLATPARWTSARFIATAFAACWLGAGCAAGSAQVDVAAEQQRCAAVWRSRGDSDRAAEMQRRSVETRRAEASAHPKDDFLSVLLDLLFPTTKWTTSGDPRPYTDPRGCE